MTEELDRERALVALLREQRAMLAEFGREAITTADSHALMQRACELVSRGCDIKLVKVLEIESDGKTLLIRAGVNWKPGVVGHTRFGMGAASPAGYALLTDKPIVSPDLSIETRFTIPPVLKEHGVRSMVNVAIRTDAGPWGVLEVDAPDLRDFNRDDINFLHTYANLIGVAITRIETHRRLEQTGHELQIAARELQHRVKNILANVHALARRTARVSPNLERFMASFEERLHGLARTQELLMTTPEQDLPLIGLFRRELDAHGAEEGRTYTMSGEPTTIGPRTMLVLGMAIHELATNAVKHGSLSRPGGRIDISWRPQAEDGAPAIRIDWRESGGPPHPGTPGRSVGRDIIENTIPYMLGGRVDWRLEPMGLSCTIVLPADDPATNRRRV
jgi:two-component sensor histidine kinase